ncbi:MAG: methyltransferase family protein [Methylococcaceae bacterium]|nr:isoprenylcysteine carboxylmethyltransferase family protein [Prolixibacteraceae bacterium]
MKASYVIKHIVGSLIFFSILFISAGRINYWQGIIYVALGLIMASLNYTVFKIDPELLAERSKPGQNTPWWDKAILGLTFLVTISMYVVAGLDSGRYHWSPEFPWTITVLGIVLTMAGQLIFLVAQKQNKYFSSTVRIQTNREHKVCESGLYHFVRHPAYLGMMLQAAGFPLLIGSIWSIVPIGLMMVLLITRTSLEDRMLLNELKGYLEYSERTEYRILPYVW